MSAGEVRKLLSGLGRIAPNPPAVLLESSPELGDAFLPESHRSRDDTALVRHVFFFEQNERNFRKGNWRSRRW